MSVDPDAEIKGTLWTKGDRGFSHYTMKWGTVAESPDADDWFYVANDDGTRDWLNEVRFIKPAVAAKYGYGTDPKEAEHA